MTVVEPGTPDEAPALLAAFQAASTLEDVKAAAVELIYYFAPDLRPEE